MVCERCRDSREIRIGKNGLTVLCPDCLDDDLDKEDTENNDSEEDMAKKVREMTPDEREAKRKYQREWVRNHRNQPKKKATPAKQLEVIQPVLQERQNHDLKPAELRVERMTAIVIVLRGNADDVNKQLNQLLNI